jgi:hypothetical protein
MMRRIDGKCHCGNIAYEFHWPLEGSEIPVRACSCSFCSKHGGIYTSHREAALRAVIQDQSLITKYIFATKTAEFFICSRCGAVPFVTSMIQGRLYAVVNANTFEGVDRASFQSRADDFDGETPESRLERRRRNWIPNVTIENKGA